MQSNEVAIVTSIVAGGLIQLLFVWGLRVWGSWVATRQGCGVWWRRATWAPLLGLLVGIIGLAWTSVQLIHVFRNLAVVSAEKKAEVLSAGISNAMVPSAILISLSTLLYWGAIITFVIGSIRSSAESRAQHDGFTPEKRP